MEIERDLHTPICDLLGCRYPILQAGMGGVARSIAEFADLLHASQVELVVDVRHMPRSRSNPQFNREVLPDVLKSLQIGYVHLAALGGLRRRRTRDFAQPALAKH